MHQQRKAVSATMVAFLLPILIVILGFGVDFAYMQLIQAELQSATDLAAKAASAVLSDTGDIAAARAAGRQVASANPVGGISLRLEDEDFVFGNTTRPGSGKWEFTPNGTPLNGVRVSSRRTSDSPDGEVDLFFSSILGRDFPTTAVATAGFINTDICLVLDRSSSMKLAVTSNETMLGSGSRSCDIPWADSRWVALSSSITQFVARMNVTLAEERIAIVTYASDYSSCSTSVTASTVNQPLTNDMTAVTSAMNTLNTSLWFGMTETSKGMQLGVNELTGGAARNTAQKVMILLTDGAYTNGVDPVTIAENASGNSIKVHTITFGAVPQYVIDNMQDTARAGGGDHFHAPDADTLDDVFLQIAGSLTILTE